MSIFERQKEFHSLVKYNITKNKQTGSGQIDNIRIAPITSLRINPNFVHYLYENYIVFCHFNSHKIMFKHSLMYLSFFKNIKVHLTKKWS